MPKIVNKPISIDLIKKWVGNLEDTLDSFGMRAKVVSVESNGQAVEYRLKVADGTKLTKIKSLAPNFALATSSPTGEVKVETPIPGTDLVGITIPIPNANQTKRKKSYEVITITKTIKVTGYSMAEMLRDGATTLLRLIGRYSYLLADKTSQIGKRDLDLYGQDPLYYEAWEALSKVGVASTTYLQRKMSLGYNRASKLIDTFEKERIISAQVGIKPRVVLKPFKKGYLESTTN